MSAIPTISSSLVDNASKRTLESMATAISNGDISTKEQLRNAVYESFLNHFDRLTSFKFEPAAYDQYSWKDPSIINTNIALCEGAFKLLSTELKEIIDILLTQEALLSQTSTDVVANLEEATAALDVIENQIERRQFFDKSKAVLTLFDDFSTTNKVDFSVNNPAKILPGFGAELPNKSDNNWASKVIDIQVSPSTVSAQDDTIDNKDRLPIAPAPYEGKRFDYPERARPSGGSWRISAANTKIDSTNPALVKNRIYSNLKEQVWPSDTTILDSDYKLRSDISSKSIIQDSERFDDRLPTDVKYVDSSVEPADSFANTITREDFIYYEANPSSDELLASQMKMFDGKLDTFWEIEYTPIVANLGASTVAVTAGQPMTDLEIASASTAYSSTATSVASTLLTKVNDGLGVSLIITFDNSYSMNYITLDPFFFGDIRNSRFTVIDISTKPVNDPAKPFVKLPGFDTDFTNTLTYNANSQISVGQASAIEATNSSQFIGKGMWTVPAGTRVQVIKFDLLQTRAIANPYPLHNVQLLRKLSKTISESKSDMQSGGSGFESGSTNKSGSGQLLERGRMTQWVQFGYLETVINTLSTGASTSMLAGTTSSSNVRSASSNSQDSSYRYDTGGLYQALGTQIGSGFGTAVASGIAAAGPTGSAGAAIVTPVAAGLGGALGSFFDKNESNASGSSQNISSEFNDSGYYVNKEWDNIKWDRCRYAIGIREIAFYAKTFDTVGELMSTKYEVLNGSKEITLSVRRSIPAEMITKYPANSWIEYYIVIDGTKHRIQPVTGESVQFSGSSQIPSSLVLNKLSNKELVSLQFYARITRPTDTGTIVNAETMTPILHGYEINIVDL